MDPRTSQLEEIARRHPVTAFLVAAFAVGLPVLVVPLLVGLPQDPFLLALVFGGLLAPALLVTRVVDGPGAVRRFLARTLRWRFGVGRWAVIVLAVPLLTLGIAAGSGTLSRPERGVLGEAGVYLFMTFVFGALLLNIWEEAAWGGFVQTRLMARHGLLAGAFLTAAPFAAIHFPLLFAEGWTWPEVWTGVAYLCVAAPFYRYLLSLHLLATGGSILAIGVQHASWNAAGNIDGVDGDWQQVAAVVVLTLFLAVLRRSSGGHGPTGDAPAQEAPTPPRRRSLTQSSPDS